MTLSDFDALTNRIWTELLELIPEDLKSHFHKIQILIADEPSPEVLAELADSDPDLAAHPEELCGLHMGVPLPDELVTSPTLFPTRVYLFRKALIDMCGYDGTPETLDLLEEEIAITLLHEVGHFFGLDEEDLERLGYD
ncbi:MAG TPA: metallopeptidase family protein [Pseudobdellovibrionaceae bacterium]|nr:metallopeptidase family protein [Pseudobdellovibrionaceae bacterium]